MADSLWTIFESKRQGMTRELIEQFRQRAAADGVTPTTALVRLLERYIRRGFDDDDTGSSAPFR